MTMNQRPAGLHPQTWRRVHRAADCLQSPPPPVTETLSNRYREARGILSDGSFHNDDQHSEPFSSTFVVGMDVRTLYHGQALINFSICLLHQGIVMFAPMLDRTHPYAYGVCIDTTLPLSFPAAQEVMDFVQREDRGEAQVYSRSWARCISRSAWHQLSTLIRDNLRDNAHITFE